MRRKEPRWVYIAMWISAGLFVLSGVFNVGRLIANLNP
jgi:hypothetical protein